MKLLIAILLAIWFFLGGCNTQTIKRLETHVGNDVTYENSYKVVSIPVLGGKNEAIHNYETVGLNNVKAGQSANSDTTAMATTFTKFIDLLSGLLTKTEAVAP